MSEQAEAACSLRWDEQAKVVEIIDQTKLPHSLVWVALESLDDYCHAISAMLVRGAPLIGVTAAFGLAHALQIDPGDAGLKSSFNKLLATRPTAVNLRWALEQIEGTVKDLEADERAAVALRKAIALREADIASCSRIGDNGLELLRALPRGDTLNIMTHCNAGWLAAIQWGTALAPIYKAQEAGIPVHVWVSETRPRNQGAHLTAWELQRAGVPCTLVADNSCGQLMREGKVDCIIVGSDRTASNGDVCNKVGTYLKALAANANSVPFYVALPASTIDWRCAGGDDIPIEERGSEELLYTTGIDSEGVLRTVRTAGEAVVAANPAFDVTPAKFVDSLMTDGGNYSASREGLRPLQDALRQQGLV